MQTGEGFLAIWSDVPETEETNYLHWLTREHASERVSLPGFLRMRLFRARLAEVRRYFILYHLETPSIIRSEPYLARVNAPTEWSRQIMPLLKNFIRGGGQRMTFGLGGGAIVAPIQFDRPEMPLFRSAAKKIGALDRIVSTALLETDEIASAIPSREKSLRQPDQSFAALLIIEALDDLALDVAIDELRKTEYSGVQITRYEQIFGLDKAG